MKAYSEAELEAMTFSPLTGRNYVVRAKDIETAIRLGLEAGKDYKVSFVSTFGSSNFELDDAGEVRITHEPTEHLIYLSGVMGRRFPLHEFLIVSSRAARK